MRRSGERVGGIAVVGLLVLGVAWQAGAQQAADPTARPARAELDASGGPSQPATRPTTRPTTRPAKLTAEEASRLAGLLAGLGADDFQTRETSHEAIVRMGPGALPYVRKHVDDDDAEVADRSQRIVTFLESFLPIAAEKIEIGLSVDKPKYKVGDRVRVTIRIQNQGQKPARINDGKSAAPWQAAENFTLRGPDGGRILPREPKGATVRHSIYSAQVVAPHSERQQSMYFKIVKAEPGADMPASRPAGAGAAPAAYLQVYTNGSYFALPAAGKYRLRFRLPGLFGKDEKGGQDPVVMETENGSVELRPPASSCPIAGDVDSGEATFEVAE